MKIKISATSMALFAALAISGCVHHEAPMEEAAETPTVYYSMTDIFQPQFQGFADTAFWLYNEDGELDASGVSEEQWALMEASAMALQETAFLFSEEDTIRVAEPGEQLFNEGKGFIPSEDVQAVIDANPDGFRAMMAYLANESQTALEAVQARDAEAVSNASDSIYASCKSCHVAFWYPGRR